MITLNYSRTITQFSDNQETGFFYEEGLVVPLDVFMGYVELLQCNGYNGSWKDSVFTLIGYNRGRQDRTEIVLAF